MPARWRPVPLDRVHQLAVLAILAIHVDRDHGVDRRNQEKDRKDQPEEQARNDHDQVEHAAEIGWPLSSMAAGGTKTARI